MKKVAKVGEEGEDIDVKLSDLGRDSESDGEGESMLTKDGQDFGED